MMSMRFWSDTGCRLCDRGRSCRNGALGKEAAHGVLQRWHHRSAFADEDAAGWPPGAQSERGGGNRLNEARVELRRARSGPGEVRPRHVADVGEMPDAALL